MAAGLTIKSENVDAFRENLAKHYRKNSASVQEPRLNIDFEVIKPKLLTIENVAALDLIGPYGLENLKPILCMLGVEVQMLASLSGGKHTKLWVCKDGDVFEGIFFSKSIDDLKIKVGDMIDIAFYPQVNEFRGRKSIQLLLEDLKIHEG